jgi:hypothetical protein
MPRLNAGEEKKDRRLIMKDDNYIVIKGWMINKLGLSGSALLVYATIYGFSQDGESCFRGSIPYLASCAGITDRGMRVVLQRLLEKGFIEKDAVVNAGIQYNTYRALDPEEAAKKVAEMAEKSSGGREKSSGKAEKSSGKTEKSSANIILYNNNNKTPEKDFAGQAGVKPEELKAKEDPINPILLLNLKKPLYLKENLKTIRSGLKNNGSLIIWNYSGNCR